LSLDGRESRKLVLRHVDLLSALELVALSESSGDEVGSVRVHGLVSGSSSGKSFSRLVDNGGGSTGGLSLLEVLDDGELHGVLDQVHGEVPDNVPNPDDTDPTTRDGLDVGETPVTEGGNDGRDQLSETEGNHQGVRRSLGPRRSVRSGNEDKSLRDDGNLEVDNHVCSGVVVVLSSGLDTESVLEEGGVSHDGVESKGGSSEVETVTDTVGKDLGQIPRVRGGGWQDSVEGQGHDGTVVKDSDDKNHERREIKLPTEGHDGKADDDTDGNGTGVDGVVSHSLENNSGSVDGVNNGGKSGLGQNDISGTSGSIGGTLDGDTDVGTGKSGSIVGTVTSHGTQVAKTLNSLDNLELVLGEDTSETIGVHDHFVKSSVLGTRGGSLLEDLGGVHVVTKTESSTSLLGNSKLITGNHLDLDTESHGVVDGLLGVGTGRVEDGQKTDELETVTLGSLVVSGNILESDSEGSETSSGKLLDVGLELVFELVVLASGTDVDDDTSHTLGGSLELTTVSVVSVGDFSSLVDRVEGLEVKEIDTISGKLGVGKGTDDTTVNGVLVLDSGSVGSEETDTLDVPLGVALDVLLVDGKLVGGEGTGLVGTEDGDTSELFNGSDSGNNGLVLGELLSTDSEGDGQDGRHSDGDTTNQKDKDVVETTSVSVSVVGVKDEDLEQDEDTDGNQTERTDLGENHLQVTGLVVVLTDESSSSTEESVGTGRDDDTLGLSLLTGRTRETLVTELLALGKGLSSKSGLVHTD
jgi:hypothetical protein